MFFFRRRLKLSKYNSKYAPKQTFGTQASKSSEFAEKIWFGFMLLFALPLLLPFLVIAFINKTFAFVFGKSGSEKDLADTFSYIVDQDDIMADGDESFEDDAEDLPDSDLGTELNIAIESAKQDAEKETDK